ncbi:DNA-binding protein [Streptomyces sp. DH18]|nr:DNA-binding protein [Streptomyces sp. DH18]MDG9684637.1 DNA-binding protein [Streptomyces sp. DH18]
MSGTLVLDCEGLSKLVRRTPEITEWLAAAEAEDIRVVTSSVTLVEARDPRVDQDRFDYATSRVNIIPPAEAIARHASKLLARPDCAATRALRGRPRAVALPGRPDGGSTALPLIAEPEARVPEARVTVRPPTAGPP